LGAVLVHPALAAHVPAGTIAIRTTQTYLAWAREAAASQRMQWVSRAGARRIWA
jgi:hypothetical protein